MFFIIDFESLVNNTESYNRKTISQNTNVNLFTDVYGYNGKVHLILVHKNNIHKPKFTKERKFHFYKDDSGQTYFNDCVLTEIEIEEILNKLNNIQN